MNRLTKSIKQLTALLLSLVLVFGILPPTPTHAEGKNELIISTDKELRAFSKSCTLDSYSKGLTVKLSEDINLGNNKFVPIPIFYGTFDGQGHLITGLNISSKGSNKGLFRSVELGAVVCNLEISGDATPRGSAATSGLIAGTNAGLITNCTVSGTINAKADVGGIAGINLGGGIISNCVSKATVSGEQHTGGIVGKNDGHIENCTNNGKVNVSSELKPSSPEFKDLDAITDTVSEAVSDTLINSGQSNTSSRDSTSLSDISDTGGIAGRSSGVIKGCTNNGEVGYNHIGYNTGGIVGIQNGIVSNCENSGNISGRKDVGGIVGQFEPDIALSFGANSGQNLNDQLTKLTFVLKDLTNSLNETVGGSMNSASDINSAVKIIEKTLKEAGSTGGDEGKATLDSIHSSLQTINTSADKLYKYISDFTKTADAELKVINSGLTSISNSLVALGDTASAAVTNAKNEITAQTTIINEQITIIQTAMTEISNAMGNLQQLTTDVGKALNNPNPVESRKQIQAALDAYSKTVNTDSISTALKNMSEAIGKINTSIKAISTTIGKNVDIIDAAWKSASGTIKADLDSINPAMDRLINATTAFSNGMAENLSVINKEMKKLEDLLNTYLNSAGERIGETFDTIYEQLNTINNGLSDIIGKVAEGNEETRTMLDSAIDQMNALGQTIGSMLDTPQYTSVDVSSNIEILEKPGQVSVCRSSGKIAADSNVGGIAGIIALEMGNDPEEDFAMHTGLWGDTTALFRAIVMTSANSGEVSAKNGYAGGAVGRSDVGAIYKTDNLGNVAALNGAECGGIAGSSQGGIIQCNVLCDLSGSDNIGGIAGSGSSITNCRSMVRIESEGECLGAVAGNANGEISGNIFVKEELAGIDGVSYDTKASPLPYSEFIKLPSLPAFFTDLHIDFLIDGKTIKSVPFAYGDALPENSIPELPKREGSFGVWEDFETTNLIRSATVNAEYSPWISTLSSGEDVPLLLAEGSFSNKAKLSISEIEPTISIGGIYKELLAYTYSLTDEDRPTSGSFTFRLHCNDKRASALAVVTNKHAEILHPKRDGSYLVFTAPAKGELVLLHSIAGLLILIACIAVALIIIILFIRYMKKHFPNEKKPPKAKKAKKPKSGVKLKSEAKSGTHLDRRL
ncbi:MAG: GLUG motif-containing protein [Oscillospiraceae bacterium]